MYYNIDAFYMFVNMVKYLYYNLKYFFGKTSFNNPAKILILY